LKEEDRKDEVKKVNEEERSSEEEVIRRMMMTMEERPLYPSPYIPSFLPSSSYLSAVPSST
jgi:hypothetical protein